MSLWDKLRGKKQETSAPLPEKRERETPASPRRAADVRTFTVGGQEVTFTDTPNIELSSRSRNAITVMRELAQQILSPHTVTLVMPYNAGTYGFEILDNAAILPLKTPPQNTTGITQRHGESVGDLMGRIAVHIDNTYPDDRLAEEAKKIIAREEEAAAARQKQWKAKARQEALSRTADVSGQVIAAVQAMINAPGGPQFGDAEKARLRDIIANWEMSRGTQPSR